jgi:hypothetical protein
MAQAARTSTAELVRVLERLPHYDLYLSGEKAIELESSYRVGVGRMVKSWGDQLLDIAEEKPRMLSRQQTGMIDNLLQEISEIFRVLNQLGELQPFEDPRRVQSARQCDARLLASLDEAHRLIQRLRQREFSGVWVEQNFKPFYRKLRHIERLLARRNRLLGVSSYVDEAAVASQEEERGERL